jgi:hypothetical protein
MARRRNRKRTKKLIPDADRDFSLTGQAFARVIERDPQRFMLTDEDAQRIRFAMTAFAQALRVTSAPEGHTKIDTMRKCEARDKAADVVREYANIIRANPKISAIDKAMLRIKQRPQRPKDREVPQTAPFLFFKGVVGGGVDCQCVHVIEFLDKPECGTRARPAGVVRVELFVELVAPNEPVPKHPGELGRPWYLRSFTRSPMKVKFPVPTTPMKVVYWARWANATGETGPWSKTCEAGLAGWPNAGALEDKRKGARVVVRLLRRALPLVEEPEEQKLLECEATTDEPRALPEAA